MPKLQFEFDNRNDIHPDIDKILRYFPAIIQDSKLMQAFAVAIFEENNSRINGLARDLVMSTKAEASSETIIGLWETAVDVASEIGANLGARRANVLSKTIRKNRIRTSDLANIARNYIAGSKTYTIHPAVDETVVRVRSIEGFTIGNEIYIGELPVIIVDLIPKTREMVLDREVTAHAYELVTTSLVQIEEIPASYAFNLIIEIEDLLNEQGLIDAIEAAKPAHLNGTIIGGANDVWIFEDIDSTFETSSKTFGVRVFN